MARPERAFSQRSACTSGREANRPAKKATFAAMALCRRTGCAGLLVCLASGDGFRPYRSPAAARLSGPVTDVHIHGADLHVEDTGGQGEPVLFLHGFMFDGRQYERQVAAFRDRYRCLTLDFRGQGRSSSPRGGYRMDQQTADVLAVIRRLRLPPVHLVGLSMGGFVAQRIAARTPELLRSLTLLNTSARPHQVSKVPLLLALTAIARIVGIGPRPIVSATERELYGRAFRVDPERTGQREVWRRRWSVADRAGLARTMLGVLARPDMRPELADIVVPTLLIAGEDDVSLPPGLSEEMHRLIPGARLVVLAGTGHSSPIEDPEAVTGALAQFLDGLGEAASRMSE